MCRSWQKLKNTDAMQRHTIFDRKACIAYMNNGWRPCTVQRHTFSGRKPCIASTEREKNTDAVQRHTFFDRKACVANINNDRTPCSAQRHTISRGKPRIASTRSREKADAAQRHTFSGRKTCIATRKSVQGHAAMQRHTISKGKPRIANTRSRKNTETVQRHTQKLQFACINYDIQKNLCTFQIFLTCIFSSHFCFSLKVIPRQALPSAKKHEKDLSFMLVGRRRDPVPIKKGLYPRDNLSVHRRIRERVLTSGILPDVQPCTHMCQDRE